MSFVLCLALGFLTAPSTCTDLETSTVNNSEITEHFTVGKGLYFETMDSSTTVDGVYIQTTDNTTTVDGLYFETTGNSTTEDEMHDLSSCTWGGNDTYCYKQFCSKEEERNWTKCNYVTIRCPQGGDVNLTTCDAIWRECQETGNLTSCARNTTCRQSCKRRRSPRRRVEDIIIVPVLWGSLILVGLLGNGCVVYVLLRFGERKVKSPLKDFIYMARNNGLCLCNI